MMIPDILIDNIITQRDPGGISMSVIYYCRHCGTKVGEIEDDTVSEYALGFHHLTPEERSELISYQAGGNVTVKVVCDYCKSALDANPELSLLPNPLQ
jgi:hypothetical protein